VKERLVTSGLNYIKAQEPYFLPTPKMSDNNNNSNDQLADKVNDAKSSLGEICTNVAGIRANLGMVVVMVETLAGSLDNISGTTDRVVSDNVQLAEENRRLKKTNTINKRQCTIACRDNRMVRAEALKSAEKNKQLQENKKLLKKQLMQARKSAEKTADFEAKAKSLASDLQGSKRKIEFLENQIRTSAKKAKRESDNAVEVKRE
jgi:hypothetical protein